MIVNVDLPPDKMNDVYIPYLNCNTRIQIFFGGASSGKSYFILAQRTILDILRGGRNFLIARKTAKTNRISTYNEIVKAIHNTTGLSKLFSINKSDMTITCVNGYQIYFVGLDDFEKLKSITPAKGIITDLLLEEATELSRDDFKNLSKRLRGLADVPKRQTFLFNPIYLTHWIVEEFFKGKFHNNDTLYHDDNLLILKTTYKDNRFLEEEDRQALENEKDSYYYNVYTLGNWGVLGGIIFENFKVEDLNGKKDNFNTYYNGLDFGFTNDPTALIRCAVHHNDIYITAEAGGHGWTNDVTAERIRPIIGNDYVICDSAEPKSIAELKQYGIQSMGVKKSKDYLLHIIQWIKQYQIIVDRSCQNMINELNLFQWAKDKDGNVINKPVDKNNHWIDAFLYAVSRIAQDRRGTMSKVRY